MHPSGPSVITFSFVLMSRAAPDVRHAGPCARNVVVGMSSGRDERLEERRSLAGLILNSLHHDNRLVVLGNPSFTKLTNGLSELPSERIC